MKRKLSKVMIILFCLNLILTGCSNKKEKDNTSTITGVNSNEQLDENSTSSDDPKELKPIKIGASPNVVEVVKSMELSLEELGYDLEVVSFDDITLPNVALFEGSIDANLYQHEPFLNTYNENNGTNLQFLEPLFGGFTGLYSNKYDSADELPQGAKIGIFSDGSNQHRALVLAQDEGMITLNAKTEGLYNLLDIKDNPRNLEIIPLESATLVGSINDLDASFIQGTSMYLANEDPNSYIAREKDNSHYGIGLVVSEENKEVEWINDVLKAFRTEDTKQKINDYYKRSYVFFE